MAKKIDSTTLDQLIIRRTLHNAAGRIAINGSEFSATWHDSVTHTNIDFAGTVNTRISLKTARFQGSSHRYELKSLFSEAELRGFNYLISAELLGRTRWRDAV